MTPSTAQICFNDQTLPFFGDPDEFIHLLRTIVNADHGPSNSEVEGTQLCSITTRLHEGKEVGSGDRRSLGKRESCIQSRS